MNSRKQQQWQELCLRAVKEPDPAKQMEIVAELNRILQEPKKSHAVAVGRGLKQGPSH
jgi:hypothetical protein